MYNITELVDLEATFKDKCKDHFIKFFKDNSYEGAAPSKIVITNIESHDSIFKLRYGSGLYLLLTDYMKAENPCTLEYDGLKAIYRGHGV
jgi:hypothetical protein